MLKYDFHIHTALSPCGDNDMTPNNIVNMCKILGVDIIGISDHNSMGNVKSAIKVGESVGVKIVPAMEVETAEEVHILTLFPDINSGLEVEKIVRSHLPNIKNRPEIFGEQMFFDEYDNITGYEEQLLITSTDLSVYQLSDIVKSVGGLFVPAHIDRHSYSILTNLGFIPEDLHFDFLEISTKVTDVESYIDNRGLHKYNILQNSDSHYLANLAENGGRNLEFCLKNEFFEKFFK